MTHYDADVSEGAVDTAHLDKVNERWESGWMLALAAVGLSASIGFLVRGPALWGVFRMVPSP